MLARRGSLKSFAISPCLECTVFPSGLFHHLLFKLSHLRDIDAVVGI